MEYSWDIVVPASVFLACKTEDAIVTLRSVVETTLNTREEKPVDDMIEAIRQFELEFCSHLRYQFIVHGPFRPLRGLLVVLAESVKGGQGTTHVTAIGEKARILLRRWWLGDAMLLYPPSQLALAAIERVAAEMKLDLNGFFQNLLKPTEPDDHVPALENIALECERSLLDVEQSTLQVGGRGRGKGL